MTNQGRFAPRQKNKNSKSNAEMMREKDKVAEMMREKQAAGKLPSTQKTPSHAAHTHPHTQTRRRSG